MRPATSAMTPNITLHPSTHHKLREHNGEIMNPHDGTPRYRSRTRILHILPQLLDIRSRVAPGERRSFRRNSGRVGHRLPRRHRGGSGPSVQGPIPAGREVRGETASSGRTARAGAVVPIVLIPALIGCVRLVALVVELFEELHYDCEGSVMSVRLGS